MTFEVHDGRVLTWALETHVADHCNLRCVECCTLSPRLDAWTLSPEALARDLELAATALRPQLFKLTGGEPLLNPELTELARVARASGIASQVSLTTNGWLLDAAPDALFEALDRITLSHYSSAPLPEDRVEAIAARCRDFDVALGVKRIDRFARMDPEAPLPPAQATAVHAACWLRVRCHLVTRGRFYPCTRPPHLAALHGDASLLDDGVPLCGDALLERLLACLESEQAYASCARCLGASGGWIAHAQARA